MWPESLWSEECLNNQLEGHTKIEKKEKGNAIVKVTST